MKNKTPSRRKRRGSFRWLKVIALVFLALGLLRIGRQVNEYQGLQAQLAVYQQQLSEATAVYDQSRQELALLEDDSYVERIAREKLGMVQEGESVVMAMKPTTATAEE